MDTTREIPSPDYSLLPPRHYYPNILQYTLRPCHRPYSNRMNCVSRGVRYATDHDNQAFRKQRNAGCTFEVQRERRGDHLRGPASFCGAPSKPGAPEWKIEGGTRNGAPEMRGPGKGTGRGQKSLIPCPTPRYGAVRGIFAGPRPPGANTGPDIRFKTPQGRLYRSPAFV